MFIFGNKIEKQKKNARAVLEITYYQTELYVKIVGHNLFQFITFVRTVVCGFGYKLAV